MTGTDAILAEAASWHASMSGDNPDFDGFATWLEADPAHRAAYDRLVLLDALIDDHADQLRAAVPANDSGEYEAMPRRKWWPSLVAVAAALVLALIFVPRFLPGSLVTESTAIGQVRTIALGNDAQIHLDAASAVRFQKGDHRRAELVQGRALFDVRHNADAPFTLSVGAYQVRDVGTRFEVRRDGDDVTISVSEGAVAVGGQGIAFVQANAGEQINIANGQVNKTKIDANSVASWRDGRLIFDNAPLSQVVADINRHTKKKLALDPSLNDQRFSGVLTIGDGSQLARNLADLMGLSLAETDEGQILGRRP